MHILIGLLGSIVTILWLLHRLAEMGIDLGGLNPWLWRRRRAWRQQHDANPIFSIEDPMEATALLMTAVAKADGDMSSAERRQLLATFESEFSLSSRDAGALLNASVHLLGRGDEVREDVGSVMKSSIDTFTEEQAASAIELISSVADIDRAAVGVAAGTRCRSDRCTFGQGEAGGEVGLTRADDGDRCCAACRSSRLLMLRLAPVAPVPLVVDLR